MLDHWRRRIGIWRRRRISRQADRLDRYLDLSLGLAPARTCHQEARAVYIGDDTLLCRVQGRHYLYAPSRDLNITPAPANFGQVDPWISRVIARTVKPGMVVADVGANLGYFTLQLAHRVGPGGRVHAFEPNVDLARLIRRSATANHFGDEIVIHTEALGDDDGRAMWLCVPGDALAGAAVHDDDWRRRWLAPPESGDERQPGKEARAVTLRRLDSLPDARAIAFAKIDVEGFEPQVLAGMTGMMAADALRTIIMEYTAAHYANAEAFVGHFTDAGWQLSIIDPQQGPAPISRSALATLNAARAYDLLLTR